VNKSVQINRKNRSIFARLKTTWFAPTLSFFIIVFISVASYSAQTRTAKVQEKNDRNATEQKAKESIESTFKLIETNTSQVASFYDQDSSIFESNSKNYLTSTKYNSNVKSVAFMAFVPMSTPEQNQDPTISFIQPRNQIPSQSENADDLTGNQISSITDLSSEINIAKNSGKPSVSQPFINNVLMENQNVFIALVYPIFTKEIDTPNQSEGVFQGVLVAPISLDIFLDSAQKRSQTFKTFRITDSENNVIANGNRFFESDNTELATTVAAVGDRNFRIEYDVVTKDTSESTLARRSTLGTGLGLAVIVFILFSMMRLNERRARKLADEAEREVYASEARFSALIQQSSDITLVIDSEGKIKFASPSVESKIGYKVRDIVGKNIASIVGIENTTRKTIQVLKSLNSGKHVEPFEAQVLANDGTILTFECVINDLRNDDAVQGIVCNSRDITERKTAESQIAKAKALYESALENAPIGVALVHQDGQCFFANEAMSDFLGRTSSEVNDTRIRDFVYQDDKFAFSDMWQSLEHRGTERTSKELRFEHPDGRQRWGNISIQGAYDGEVFQYYVVQIEDTTERRSIAERLEYQAIHDPLTGLPNRLLFVDRLEVALLRAKRTGLGVSVLFLDLDRFKVVNDSLGHAAGDTLLEAVSERIKSSVRPNDTIARFGGDEFVVLCEDISDERQTNEIANRLLESINRPIMLREGEVYVTASIGIARSLTGEDTPETILRDADTAMYRAKDGGRNRSEVFDERTHARAVANLETGNGMFRALSENEFRMRYQPIISLKSGRLSGFEALVYWQHPERGHVGPNDFITLAEETGVIVPLGLRILEEACTEIARWNSFSKQSAHLTMSVNLSPRQLAEPTFVEEVRKILERTKVNPARIWFEITENALMVDADSTIAMLDQLKNLGVHFEVDDFGTGFSSLSYLKKFPVDALKIDQGFVDGLGRDPEDSAIVTAVVSLSHALGLQAIAEGVETPLQMAELKTLGCEYAQGYLFARPDIATSWDSAVRSNELFTFQDEPSS